MSDRILVALAVALVVASIAVGYGGASVINTPSVATTTKSQVSTTTVQITQTAQNSSAPYILTLVLSTRNIFNSTVGEQPAFFVLGPKGLEPATHISVPAHRQIELVIIDYDDGNATVLNPSYADVNGTAGNTITYGSNDLINASQKPSGISIAGAITASSVPEDQIAHTFTVPSLGINVPVPISAVVVTTFKIEKTGTFIWYCETPCGSGSDGLGGAMSTMGWMTGSFTVS